MKGVTTTWSANKLKIKFASCSFCRRYPTNNVGWPDDGRVLFAKVGLYSGRGERKRNGGHLDAIRFTTSGHNSWEYQLALHSLCPNSSYFSTQPRAGRDVLFARGVHLESATSATHFLLLFSCSTSLCLLYLSTKLLDARARDDESRCLFG